MTADGRSRGMPVGMTLPVMEPDLAASTLESWSTYVDEGPFFQSGGV